MKTKAQAAAFLQVSERTVERYAGTALTVHYEQGKTRPRAVFDEAELKALKHELTHPTTPVRPALVGASRNGDQHAAAPVLLTFTPDQFGELTTRMMAQFADTFAVKQLGGSNDTAASPAGTGGKNGALPPVPLTDKLTLKLAEAAQLAGLAQNFLREQIKGKKLKAEKRGRGWNIKRADLDAFIRKL